MVGDHIYIYDAAGRLGDLGFEPYADSSTPGPS